MSKMASGTVQYDRDDDDPGKETQAEMATPGGDREVKWEVVTETAGLAPAEIIAGHLQAEGIPARAWQEGAGRAFGLTVGLLGNGYVMVPEPYVEQAKEILAASPDEYAFDEDFTGEEE